MGRILVRAADLNEAGTHLDQMRIQLGALPHRVVGRDEVIRLLKEQHSFIPFRRGAELPALQLVELDTNPVSYSIRSDNQPVAEDALPELPSTNA